MQRPTSAFENPTKGKTHQVVLAEIFYIGKVRSEYKGVVSEKDKVRVVVQTEEKSSKGYRHQVSADLTFSVGPKAKLGKLLSQWLGKKIKDEDFDSLDQQFGKLNGLMQIEWKGPNEEYANIGSIIALPSGMPEIKLSDDYKRRAVRLYPSETLIVKAPGVEYAGLSSSNDEAEDAA